MDITKLYKNQISLSEWFENSGHKLTKEMRIEDNDKRERLKVLNEIINLPYDKPYEFMASDIANETESFKKFLEEHGSELCALRLIPLDQNLPKLRMRGHSIKEVLKWFNGQNIDATKYRSHFVPHSEQQLWSTIFVVNKKGIFGEIIKGGHHQLTQGFYDKSKPIVFSFNFEKWNLNPKNEEAERELEYITSKLKVKDEKKKKFIIKKLNSKFYKNYLLGYFETVTTGDCGLWFIDYNRLLYDMYNDYFLSIQNDQGEEQNKLIGMTGSNGVFTGKARIVNEQNLQNVKLSKEDVLVCEMTTPEHIVLMKNSGAIVTNLGGVLSHAAIIAREFKIPCLVGTKNATEAFKNGDLIEVNADEGYVKKV